MQLTDNEFITFCVNPAVRMRQGIRDELSKIDQEYQWVTILSQSSDEFQLSHPDSPPHPEKEKQQFDPLSPNRQPEEASIEIQEHQRGISFEKLFRPYIKGANHIVLYDPYIRLTYQIYNFMSFCEILEPGSDGLHLKLVTGHDVRFEAELKGKLEELKSGLKKENIEFVYSIDPNLHDRCIDTDTGWKIILGRGLDIFQKPDSQFSLGFLDQTKRKCKATRITYTNCLNTM